MKKNSSATARAWTLVLAALVWIPVDRVQAQNAADAAGSTSAQTTNAAGAAEPLQEVVVTAERRTVDIQQTPIAVTAISGNDLQELHLNSISDLQTTVPSFQESSGSTTLEINIRGMGNSGNGAGLASGVAVLRDGILMATRFGQEEPLYDIADAEVLEGPQGTFVGASSDAGAVEINSANPDFNGMSGYALAGFANYSDTRVQGAFNLPVSDTFAVRLAFDAEQRGSFYKDIGATQQGYFVNAAGAIEPLNQGLPGQSLPIDDPGHVDERAIRLKMLWKPTENFQSLSLVDYWFNTTGGLPSETNPGTYTSLFSAGAENSTTGLQAGCTLGGPLNAKQEICTQPGAVTHSTFYYPGETPFVLDYYGGAEQYDDLITRYSEELRYTLPDGIVLRSQSGFVHVFEDTQDEVSLGPQNAGWYLHQPKNNYVSDEFNVISPTTGKVNWIVGGYWFYFYGTSWTNQTSVSSPYQPGALPSTEQFTQSPFTARTMAIFGQLNWQFTDTLQLQVGARENWDNNFSSNTTSPAVAGQVLSEPDGTGTYSLTYAGGSTYPTSYTVRSTNSASGRFASSVPTGKIDLNWTPTPGQNFYVFYARGYRAGGVNTGSTDFPIFQPEHVNDYEVGWKGRLFDGHMVTQVSAYYNNYQNLQYNLFDTEENNDTTTGTYVANMAATIYGLEASEQSRFGDLGINLGIGYTHSAMATEHVLNSGALPAGFGSPLTAPQCLAGHTYTATCFDYTPYLTNVSGEETPDAPELTANISVDYIFHVGLGTIDPRVTFSHMDKQYPAIFQNPYVEMQARNLWNASVDWVVGKWDLQLYGTNLTNQVYIISDVTGTAPLYYGAPRQWGLQGKYRF